MIRSRVTFVVGAGASKEVGLPVGTDLKDRIAKKLNLKFDFGSVVQGDPEVGQLVATRPNAGAFHEGAKQIRDAMPQAISIDNYLDARQDNQPLVECGKWTIAKCILEAERKSDIYFSPPDSLNFKRVATTWYNSLFQLLTQDVRRDGLGEIFDCVDIISFNYDRCIEHYLYHALANYYRLDPPDAFAVMRKLRVIHPYGKVGDLPWEAGEMPVGYGATVSSSELEEIALRLRTFTEQVEDEDAVDRIRTAVAKSETVIFLGFAFHSQNMSLLAPGSQTTIRSAFATAFEMSASNQAVVANRIRTMARKQPVQLSPVVQELACSALFSHNWLGLSDL